LLAARQELRKSLAQKVGALSGFLPSANFSMQAEHYVSQKPAGTPVTVGSTVVGGQNSSYTSYPSLGLNWNLYAGGRDAAGYSGAQAGIRASGKEVERQTGATLMAVLGAYGDLLKAQSAAGQQQESLETLRAIRERAEQRFRQGRDSLVVTQQASLNLLQSEQDYHAACKSLSDKSAALAQAIGLRPGRSSLLEATGSLPDTVDTLIDPASFDTFAEQDPAVRSAFEKVEVARNKVEQARAAFKPTLALVARYDALGQSPGNFTDAFNATGRTGYRVGLVLQQSLGPFTTEYANVESAQADLLKARAAYDEALVATDARLRSAWNARRQTERALESAKRLVLSARQLVALVRQTHDQGRANLDAVDQALMTLGKQNDLLLQRSVEDQTMAWQLKLAVDSSTFVEQVLKLFPYPADTSRESGSGIRR
jgi:outer membrane protein TolC